MSNTLPFHEWLKKRRKALDLTVDRLAALAGCSPNSLRKLESGERRPSRQLAERLAHYLDIAPEDMAAFRMYARTGLTDIAPAMNAPPLPAATPIHPRTSISRPLTRLIGRESLLAELRALLSDQTVRLLTLTGPGGVGKTRLAQELAAELHAHVADGAVFIPLATIREPGAVLMAIMQALHVVSDADLPLDALQRALARQDLVLVLDNLEQVITVGSLLVDLLASCPRLRIVTTSRAALQVRGEQLVPVPPLEFPEAGVALNSAEVTHIAAVALLVERIQAVVPRFRVQSHDVAVIAEICRRLDGLPLALELAAARMRALSPVMLLERLDRRLPLLVGGSRELAERQQTLRSTIAWSAELLNADERDLFADLAVFAGGAALDAILAVCFENHELSEIVALDRLYSLIDQNLIQAKPDATSMRYTMLATIQEYAAELLDGSTRGIVTRDRHARWCLDLCARAVPMLNHPDQQIWIERLEAEHTNIRAALRHLLNTNRPDTLVRAAELACCVYRFWYTCGHFGEGMQWMERVLERADQLPLPLRAELLRSAGILAIEHRRMEQAEAWIETSLACARAADLRYAVAATLPILSSIREQRGRVSDAELLASESVVLFRELGDPEGLSDALDRLAQCAYYANDLPRAIRLQEEVLALRRVIGNQWLLSSTLNNLGVAVYECGNVERAVPLITEAVELVEQIGNALMAARMLLNLGGAHAALGQISAAARCYERSLTLSRVCNDQFTQIWLLRAIATLVIPSQPEAAARLFGKAEALIGQDDWRLPDFDRQRLESAILQLRTRLDPDDYLVYWHAGAQSPLDAVIDTAASLVTTLTFMAQ